MPLLTHTILVDALAEKDKSKLKMICQAWTKVGENMYVIHHSDALIQSCPICIKTKGV